MGIKRRIDDVGKEVLIYARSSSLGGKFQRAGTLSRTHAGDAKTVRKTSKRYSVDPSKNRRHGTVNSTVKLQRHSFTLVGKSVVLIELSLPIDRQSAPPHLFDRRRLLYDPQE